MSDSFVETTSKSWIGRIGQSILGVLFGIVLVIGAIVLLFWNEGRAITTARSLAEGGKVVVDVAPAPVDPGNDSKLIHVSGDAAASAPLADATFGISAVALRLVRVAEMYQWEESKSEESHKSLGGSEQTTTTYSYKKVWSDKAINSQHFRQSADHTNPAKKYGGVDETAHDAKLGAFALGAPVLELLPAKETLSADSQNNDKIGRIANAQVNDGQIYIGSNSDDPQIGDYRISYTIAPNGPVSVIGRQSGATIAQYQTKAGDRLLMAVPGTQDATAMFKDAERDNRILTWVLRAIGIAMIWLGAFLLLGPLSVIADVIPLLGDIVGVAAGIAALAIAVATGSTVIAIAWFFYRPLVSVIVIVVGLAIGFGLHRLAALRRAAPAPPAPA
jgi:hypothetical protein